jgi:HEAT repeat protein
LLMGATRDSMDPGVRMDSVEMLAGQSGLEIRNAIVNTIKHDPNAAVRVKAIESLGQFPSDSVTREALEFALGHDHDAGVRTVAMDVLVPAQKDFQVSPQLRQIISNVMHSASGDDYVSWRCAQILNEQAASNGIY